MSFSSCCCRFCFGVRGVFGNDQQPDGSFNTTCIGQTRRNGFRNDRRTARDEDRPLPTVWRGTARDTAAQERHGTAKRRTAASGVVSERHWRVCGVGCDRDRRTTTVSLVVVALFIEKALTDTHSLANKSKDKDTDRKEGKRRQSDSSQFSSVPFISTETRQSPEIGHLVDLLTE